MTSALPAMATLSVETSMPHCEKSAAARSAWATVARRRSGEEDLLLEERLEQDAAHFAGAEDGDAGVREIGHGFRIRDSVEVVTNTDEEISPNPGQRNNDGERSDEASQRQS